MTDAARVASLIDIGRHHDAVVQATRALAQTPDDAALRELLAVSLVGAGQWSAAVEAAEIATALAPESAGPHRVRSIALLRLGLSAEAVPAAREAVRLDPLDPHNLTQLAIVLSMTTTGLAESRALVGRAIELSPSDPEVRFVAGVVEHDHAPRRAAQHYREALRLDPEHASALNNLALTDSTSRWDRVAIFSGALAIDPQMPEAQANLRSSVDRLVLVGMAVPAWAIWGAMKVPQWWPVSLVVVTAWAVFAVHRVRSMPRAARLLLPEVSLRRMRSVSFLLVALGAALLVAGGILSTTGPLAGDGPEMRSPVVATLGTGMFLVAAGLIRAALRTRRSTTGLPPS